MPKKYVENPPTPQNFFGVVIIIDLIACKFSEQSEQILIFPKGDFRYFFLNQKSGFTLQILLQPRGSIQMFLGFEKVSAE